MDMGRNLRPIDIFHALKRNNSLPRGMDTYAHFRRYWKLMFQIPPPEFYNKKLIKKYPDASEPFYKGNAGKKDFIAELVLLKFFDPKGKNMSVVEIREFFAFPRQMWGIGIKVDKE